MTSRRFYDTGILAATAGFAMFWAIARAAVQSITIDEADTYLVWVARPNPSHWEAASNNHVLNSLLMRLTTGLFGATHLAVRAPALTGAAIYIAAAWALCRLAASTFTVQWSLFVALVYNPFVFDHLVAARGYALALGFLLAAIAVAAWADARDWPRTQAAGAASACLALSFAANFSFGIVNAITMTAIGLWACARTQRPWPRVRCLGAYVLPGALVTLLVSAPALLHWPRRELYYGAHSLGEWFGEIARDSLYRLNPQIVNPMLLKLAYGKDLLIPVVLVLAAWQWLRGRGGRLGYALLAVLALATAVHWTAFRAAHLLLPKERTGIWVVPLVTLAAGAAANQRRALTVALYCLSLYFLGCLRLDHFREWSWDADVKQVYGVLAYYNHAHGMRRVQSYWMYASPLNFYRVASGHETLEPIDGVIPTPGGLDFYVLNSVFQADLIEREGLHVLYRGRHSDVVVAIRPAAEVAFHRDTCGVN